MSFQITNKEIKAYILLGLLLCIYVIAEAYLMPLTHDELSTIGFSRQTITDIITYKDPIPNNHILNTLLLKLHIYIFGDNLITNRLPNILAFVVYYIFTIKLSFLLGKDAFYRSGMVILVTMQPFLFDFFSVARGYGLSLGFLSLSLYYLVLYVKNRRLNQMILSLVFAAIGVVANFTLLNYYIPLVLVSGIYLLIDGKKSKDHIHSTKGVVFIVGISIILASICYLPFKKMMATNQFQYWGNKSFFHDTVVELVYSLRSGIEYFKWNKVEYAYVISIIIAILFISGFYYYMKTKVKESYYAVLLSLFVLIIIYNNLQHYLAGVPFLNARTALFFVPLTAMLFVLSIQNIGIKKDWLGIILVSFISIVNIQHFFRANNPRANFEWYQDGETYNVLREINNLIMVYNLPKPVKFDCSWVFHPSMTYHIEKKYQGVIELMPYHKDTQAGSPAVFYYAESWETEALKEHFIAVKDYAWKTKFILMRK
jgi:hypothetical protein